MYDNDPCDEMVSVSQVMDILLGDTSLNLFTMFYYERAAAIFGLSRADAKRKIYNYCYGGGER